MVVGGTRRLTAKGNEEEEFSLFVHVIYVQSLIPYDSRTKLCIHVLVPQPAQYFQAQIIPAYFIMTHLTACRKHFCQG